MTRDELVVAVAARIEEATVGEDPMAVLSQKALNEAIQLAALVEPNSDDVEGAYVLGVFHWLRFQERREEQSDEEAIAAVRWFVRVFPWHPDGLPASLYPLLAQQTPPAGDTPGAWSAEAIRMLESAASATSVHIVDRAVRLLERSVVASASADPDRAGRLANLSLSLKRRFDHAGDVADLSRAVEVGRAAVAAAGTDHPDRSRILSSLGVALQTRFNFLDELTDLDEAIDVGRAAVAACAPDHPDRPGYLVNLGLALQARGRRVGDLADLNEAIEAGRASVAACAPGHPDRAAFWSNLGAILRARFAVSGEVVDLDEAIEVGRAAVDSAPLDHPARAVYLSNLGAALRARFERLGDRADLDAAIEASRAASASAPPDHPDRATILSNFGNALETRFGRVGDRADLDGAIEVGRAALAAAPADHPDRARYLSNLGLALAIRFEQVGDRADLDEAIDLIRAAVRATSPGHPDLAGRLSNLSNALQTRFGRTDEQRDLDEAIEAGHAAAAAAAPGHPDRAGYLSNLGIALRIRFERLGDRADLDAAIEAAQAAVQTAPFGHPDAAMYNSNLGTALRMRFERLGDRADLDAAIETGRTAVGSIPPDHPDRCGYLLNLGLSLAARFERVGDQADLNEAVAGLAEGLESESAAPVLRLRCGLKIGRLLTGRDPAGAARAWEGALRLVPLVLDRSLARDDRQHLLSEFTGVGSAAAAAALAMEDAARAWELLEQGRGVLLGQALESAIDPDLRRLYPELAEQVDQVRLDLNVPATLAGGAGFESPTQRLSRARRQAADEWARLVSVIRTKPGMARFGLPPSVDELRHAVADGVMVVINVEHRCDALIVAPGGIDYLPLPLLKWSEAIDRANSFLRATRDSRRLAANRTMRDALTWLWDTVAGPVLDQLGRLGHLDAVDGRWPRVWWSPTGPLTVLPIHASGRHDEPGAASVLDRVVSSYTPTARLLARARRMAAVQDERAGPGLAVGIENAPGYPRLADAVHEASAVNAAHARLGVSSTLLVEAGATARAVRASLSAARWVHFACHGEPGDDPADSYLALWDGPLRAHEIANLDLTGAKLAYLSACTTAFGGATLPDEAIHIASAFQVAGFAHVVATLWQISDDHAPTLAADFYQALADGQDPAYATHVAVRRLRQEFPGTPYLWAPYIHFGP